MLQEAQAAVGSEWRAHQWFTDPSFCEVKWHQSHVVSFGGQVWRCRDGDYKSFDSCSWYSSPELWFEGSHHPQRHSGDSSRLPHLTHLEGEHRLSAVNWSPGDTDWGILRFSFWEDNRSAAAHNGNDTTSTRVLYSDGSGLRSDHQELISLKGNPTRRKLWLQSLPVEYLDFYLSPIRRQKLQGLQNGWSNQHQNFFQETKLLLTVPVEIPNSWRHSMVGVTTEGTPYILCPTHHPEVPECPHPFQISRDSGVLQSQ